MREKIEILMSDTSLRVGEIAERLGVKPAVISHILKGRNQPNFVLTGKIISTFKEYNPYWWLGFSDVKFAADLNSAPSVEKCDDKIFENISSTSSNVATPSLFDMPKERGCEISTKSSAEIERVIVIYSDKSFETFTPKK